MTSPSVYEGVKISKIREMTDEEMEREYWGGKSNPLVIEMENGDYLFPSADEEGNTPGEFYYGTERLQDIDYKELEGQEIQGYNRDHNNVSFMLDKRWLFIYAEGEAQIEGVLFGYNSSKNESRFFVW